MSLILTVLLERFYDDFKEIIMTHLLKVPLQKAE